ncbi:hypothetical protein ABIB62_004621 [Mucilaginibacter sp. UYP25]|uniref:class I SAM-dependent methyltransferase n=1 Tax=unclassified Mucilaginibacter TaxID=2617802 RepID=UPI0033983426
MYETDLKNHIKSIISEGLGSYDELFSRSKGAFPDVVFRIAKSLTDLPHADEIEKNPRAGDALPEPNPSNFDWRFDHGTIKSICDLLPKYQVSRIGLFGTPSLYLPLSKQYANVTLFDINNLLLEAINKNEQVNIVDINHLDTSIYGKFNCIIMDPPWYLSYYQNWLQKANELLFDGGILITTLFQEFLRPGAGAELEQILAQANAGGDVRILNNTVRYMTPEFEKRIFKLKHIPVGGNWRIADLMIVKKQRLMQLPVIAIPKDNWTRILLNRKVIAIRQEAEAMPISVSLPFATGAQLLTVSDRDPVKKKVNLLTSDNVGLVLTGTARITGFLDGLAHGQDRSALAEKLNIDPDEKIALDTLLNLINL